MTAERMPDGDRVITVKIDLPDVPELGTATNDEIAKFVGSLDFLGEEGIQELSDELKEEKDKQQNSVDVRSENPGIEKGDSFIPKQSEA
jgi:hypothetical protein